MALMSLDSLGPVSRARCGSVGRLATAPQFIENDEVGPLFQGIAYQQSEKTKDQAEV